MIGDKILVVEDDLITAMEIRKLLETSGYQPHSACSSTEAIEKGIWNRARSHSDGC